MFCDKENVNILTAVMEEHNVDVVVICPGSRNAPLAHNFGENLFFNIPVTDERSAGYYALGLALATDDPVAVCVTSGSAMLNLAPAIAEAAYRRVPLIVISADRPADRIGQLEGQTIIQTDALMPHTPPTFTVPEPTDEATYNYCNRIANEAILAAKKKRPVHINVPISEPLYQFNTPDLKPQRIIEAHYDSKILSTEFGMLVERINEAKRPMILIGQHKHNMVLDRAIEMLVPQFVVLYESLSCGQGGVNFDGILPECNDDEYYPDFVLYAGGTFVSNRIKSFVRNAKDCEVWSIDPDGEVHDTFNKLTKVIRGNAPDILFDVAQAIKPNESAALYKMLWNLKLIAYHNQVEDFCEEWVVKQFESEVKKSNPEELYVHYANSMAVRYANKYARHYCYVNRGTNGIEGSLSTAAGFSLGLGMPTYCVIGDLSFFYDCNALWNRRINGNLRVLLLNNGGGRIFKSIPGANDSHMFDAYISASHNATAEGICRSYDAEYRMAANKEEFTEGLHWLIYANSKRPLVLECMFK